MTHPKISVLTPLYNTKPIQLRAMIESILGQTYEDFEFLILNDSPENTEIEKIVKSYDDSRIKFFVNEYNMGITKSRNKLINMATGEYLAVVDHDDISMPKRFELEAEILDKNPHIGVVGGNMYEIKDNKIISKTNFPTNDNDIKISLINEPYICTPNHPTAMIRASVLKQNNIKYDEKWTPAEDHSLWLDLINHTCFHNIPDVVLQYVWHGDNTTTRTWQKMYDILPIMINQAREKYPIYYDEWKRRQKTKKIKKVLKLFGFIPLIKIQYYK
ncbi:MAG: glycosyltransferase [Alphaproteobacteria bacterium]|nr:glycosyltransferase [Alphaproteobacteria bacterium]